MIFPTTAQPNPVPETVNLLPSSPLASWRFNIPPSEFLPLAYDATPNYEAIYRVGHNQGHECNDKVSVIAGS